ncbi:Uncharacterised protein [Vibrio cholerae]|nr:Uncharacterised protein [Vibrio cholerae]CSB18694.1 Uncharacterised protein [Vibrio cholerae]CSB53972.1 Uncharacterised protein [Vibrio cholerae]
MSVYFPLCSTQSQRYCRQNLSLGHKPSRPLVVSPWRKPCWQEVNCDRSFVIRQKTHLFALADPFHPLSTQSQAGYPVQVLVVHLSYEIAAQPLAI